MSDESTTHLTREAKVAARAKQIGGMPTGFGLTWRMRLIEAALSALQEAAWTNAKADAAYTIARADAVIEQMAREQVDAEERQAKEVERAQA